MTVREVRFKLSDAKAYSEEELRAAFRKVDFDPIEVMHKPKGAG